MFICIFNQKKFIFFTDNIKKLEHQLNNLKKLEVKKKKGDMVFFDNDVTKPNTSKYETANK